MKLSDLKINRRHVDCSKTKDIISRVSCFIREAERAEVNVMEGEADDGRYIELDLLIPSSDANDEPLSLPVNFSDSSESDDSESESEFREIIIPHAEKLGSSVPPLCTSRKLIEELNSMCTDDCMIENDV
ncbi:hypothetical protein MN116_003107 [Schistosoma mekongi]|uniref:Uncharacterized protein n=1 Tax=Schistosoma mekongi TaxID=38744 RepID=A0AAE2D6Y6_SCHME|nr:hypothetical protein MN116_003107 [Schistosoma mekongi]